MQDIAVEDRRIAVPGGEVQLRQWTPPRAGTAAPVLMLHDSLGCVALWREFPAQLAAQLGRPVIAYDRLGFGASSPRMVPPSPRFIEEEAEIIFPALRAALNLDRVILFGHSVGGGMAIAIAARHVAHCAALVTVSAQATVEPRTLDGIRAAKASFADPAQFARLARLHGERARWVLDAWTETWLSPSFADWNLDAALPEVRCPVLAIHGENDEFGSVAFPQRIAGGVPAGLGRAVILEGIGHMPHREDTAKVLALVADFLATASTRCPVS